MRFEKNYANDDVLKEDRRSMSARIHYARSSYSSHHLCYKDDSDKASKSARSKNLRRKDASPSEERLHMVSNRSRHDVSQGRLARENGQ